MSYLYSIIVLIVLCAIFVLSYYLNSKEKIECDKDDMCEGCFLDSCYHKAKKED